MCVEESGEKNSGSFQIEGIYFSILHLLIASGVLNTKLDAGNTG